MPKKHTKRRRPRYKKHRRVTRKTMRGGDFSQAELQQLQIAGFSPSQIERIGDLGVSLNEVMQKVTTLRVQQLPADELTEQAMVELLNEHIFDQPIAHEDDDVHDLDMGAMDQSFESHGSLNLDDLNTSGISDAGYTTDEDTSFGGKRRRRVSTTRKRRSKRVRGSRQRGGTCYGNGVGANHHDPNLSIYNTQMLRMFPYKP